MVEKIPKYVNGYVKIRLESPMPERFLSLCVHNQIPVWNLKNSGLYYEMELSVGDFFRLNTFRRKTQSRIILLEKHGLPFFFQRNQKRKAFFLGFLLCVSLLYICSMFIWDIRIEGNHYNSDETIWETLRSMDVTDGMRKKDLDCQQIAAGIRECFPNVVWVSAKIEGTCLVLEMKENEDSYVEKEQEETALDSWDLTAKKDGRIVEMITRQGMPLVQKGQECHKGDVLVTGRIEILNNDAQVQRYDYVGADADIFIETEYAYYHEFPLQHTVKEYTGQTKEYPVVSFLGNEFSFFRNLPDDAEIYRQEHTVYLTKSFSLPISYGKITVVPFAKTTRVYSEKEAMSISQEKIKVFMENLAAEGVKILGKNITVTLDGQKCTAKGTIQVVESCVTKTPVEKTEVPALPETKDAISIFFLFFGKFSIKRGLNLRKR